MRYNCIEALDAFVPKGALGSKERSATSSGCNSDTCTSVSHWQRICNHVVFPVESYQGQLRRAEPCPLQVRSTKRHDGGSSQPQQKPRVDHVSTQAKHSLSTTARFESQHSGNGMERSPLFHLRQNPKARTQSKELCKADANPQTLEHKTANPSSTPPTTLYYTLITDY